MMPLRDFGHYLREGVIEKRSPDRQRALSLAEKSAKRKRFIENMIGKISVSEEDADYFIENCYDVVIGLIRAKLALDGYKSSGKGAHEAEVSYMRNMGFPESDVRFMNELRYFRNGIKYYGNSFGKEYAERVIAFMDRVYPKLRQTVIRQKLI